MEILEGNLYVDHIHLVLQIMFNTNSIQINKQSKSNYGKMKLTLMGHHYATLNLKSKQNNIYIIKPSR